MMFGMPGPHESSALAKDAEALYTAATDFIRLYQFRGRDQALKFGLTVAQAYALDLLIGSGGATLNELAAGLRLDKSTTSRIVSGMAKHRLVEWSRPEHDLRAKQIVASADGRRRYARLRRAKIADNVRLLKSYSPSARRAVISALGELAQRAATA
jgi:DNA-binding MarR family transcriptional regulator